MVVSCRLPSTHSRHQSGRIGMNVLRPPDSDVKECAARRANTKKATTSNTTRISSSFLPDRLSIDHNESIKGTYLVLLSPQDSLRFFQVN